MGTAAASAGAAGPVQGLRAGWSSGRTEAGVHRGERTTHLRERADDRDSEPDYLLRPTRHGPGDLLTIDSNGSFGVSSQSSGPTKQHSNLLLRVLSSKVSLSFESLINTRGGLGRLSPPLPTFRVRYTRCVLEATGKEILQGSQQRLGRVTVTVSYSRIFFTAKQASPKLGGLLRRWA